MNRFHRRCLLKACPRCGFLNPDRGEYCMKCRYNFEDTTTRKDAAAERKGPIRDPFQVEESRAASAAAAATPPAPVRGPEPDAPPEERKLGVGAFDEPPDWARKPELVAPTPDLDDVFAGKGLDVGGYQVGGDTTSSPPAGPAVSDAYAIMTGGSAMSGSDEVAGGRRKGKRSKARKDKTPPPVPDGVNGLPPDLSINPFGMPEDTMRGASPPQAPPHDGRPQAPRAVPVQRAPQQATRSFQQTGPLADRGGPGVAPMMGSPAAGMQPPLGMQSAPPAPGYGAPAQPLGGGPAVVRRPIPEAVRQAPPARKARAPRALRSAPSIPRPNLEFLSKARDAMTPRVIVAGVAGLLVFFAVIYLLVGGNYFSNDARGLLEAAQRTMAGLSSQHIQAEVLMQTQKAGTINTAVTVDVSKDRDLHAVYGATSYRGGLEFVSAGGKAYMKPENGSWAASSETVNPDFTSAALFKNASGARLVDKQPIDGVECDHISFESSPDFARSLFPGVDVTESTRVSAEIWVDPQQKYVHHVRLDATDLETKKLGHFNCHVEAAISGYGAPVEIKAPM